MVRSTPEATLFVDGTPRARSPVVLMELPVGRHRVVLRAPGYAPHEAWVEVRAQDAARMDVTLAPAPPAATR